MDPYLIEFFFILLYTQLLRDMYAVGQVKYICLSVCMYQIKMRSVARIGGKSNENRVYPPLKLLSIDIVSFVQKHLTSSSKQITVTSHVATITKTRLGRFRRDLLSIYE